MLPRGLFPELIFVRSQSYVACLSVAPAIDEPLRLHRRSPRGRGFGYNDRSTAGLRPSPEIAVRRIFGYRHRGGSQSFVRLVVIASRTARGPSLPSRRSVALACQ